jgi:thiamine-monophosphate kinase
MARTARGSHLPIREREFHAWLARVLPAGRRGLLPMGDDAAALRPPRGTVAVVSTDSLVEGLHFLPSSSPRAVGHAAAAVSLSDIGAKGAVPGAVVLGLVVPPTTPRRWAEEVVRGAEAEAARCGAHVVGGDTKPGPVRSVGSTVIGWARPDRLAPRSGARPGDLLGTTGTVGRGGLAFERFRVGTVPRAQALRELLDVRPRVREGRALAPFAHAMLDTSDGLAESCRLMASASRVRLVIEEAALPLAAGIREVARTPDRRRAVAFFGGDYELLAAIRPEQFERAARAVARAGGHLRRIGTVSAGRGAVLRTGRRAIPMPSSGWDPFRRPRFVICRSRTRRIP